MKNNLLKNLVLIFATAILTLMIASATPQIYKITAYINGELKITYNGERFQPKDESGTLLKPIVYQNRTYLPVRAVAELTGLSIDYDKKSNTIVIRDDLTGAIPYKDGNGNSDIEEKPKENIAAPKLEGKAEGNKLVLAWKKVEDPRLQGYKIVISKSNDKPVYPDDGYLFWITDKNQTRAVIDNSEPYKSGDFGERLIPGESYYFSITVLYEGGKVSSNTIKLKYPSE